MRCVCISLSSGSVVESHGPLRHEVGIASHWALLTVQYFEAGRKGEGRRRKRVRWLISGLERGILNEALKQDGTRRQSEASGQSSAVKCLCRAQCGPGPGEPSDPAGMDIPRPFFPRIRLDSNY